MNTYYQIEGLSLDGQWDVSHVGDDHQCDTFADAAELLDALVGVFLKEGEDEDECRDHLRIIEVEEDGGRYIITVITETNT